MATEVVSLEAFAPSHFSSYGIKPTALHSYVKSSVAVSQCAILITPKSRYSAMFVYIWGSISRMAVNRNIL